MPVLGPARHAYAHRIQVAGSVKSSYTIMEHFAAPEAEQSGGVAGEIQARAHEALNQNQSETLGYQPPLDGIRAFAVLAVVLYHAVPRVAPSGGYVGVD